MKKIKMKKILYILLFLPVMIQAQDIKVTGYFNAHLGDSIGPNRTTLAKAQADCDRFANLNFDAVDVIITPPAYWTYTAPAPIEVIIQIINPITRIYTDEITATSCKVYIETGDFTEMYIRFRPIGGTWGAGGEWIETSKGNQNLLSKENLLPDTIYEYQVIVDNNRSPILIFKTL